MKNLNISKQHNTDKTQEVNITPYDSIDFRLDILRLTFTIEHNLEKVLDKTLGKRISLSEFKGMAKNETEFKEFIAFAKSIKQDKQIISTNKKLGEYFNLKTFLMHTTFGGLIKLLTLFEYSYVTMMFEDDLKKVEWKIILGWLGFIKDIRNTLAHRAMIDPTTFFQKMSTPATPKRTTFFKKATEVQKRKRVIKFFLKDESRGVMIEEIVRKYLAE